MSNMRRPHSVAPRQKAQVLSKTLRYREDQEHLLRRIASGLVLHWDEMSDELQDLIIDQAAVVQDRDPGSHSSQDIANFVRNVKVAAVSKPAAPQPDA